LGDTVEIFQQRQYNKTDYKLRITKGSIKYFTSVKYFVCHPELVSGSIDAESSSA